MRRKTIMVTSYSELGLLHTRPRHTELMDMNVDFGIDRRGVWFQRISRIDMKANPDVAFACIQ